MSKPTGRERLEQIRKWGGMWTHEQMLSALKGCTLLTAAETEQVREALRQCDWTRIPYTEGAITSHKDRCRRCKAFDLLGGGSQ